MAVYYALLRPGEKIMGMSLPFGGHLTHGWKVNFSARFYKSIQYAVGRGERIDYTTMRKMAKKERPQILVTGATAYPRVIDFKKVGEIAHEIGAYFLADISHEAGLVAAGVYPSPFPYADIVTTTTHKSLRGPRGAIIFVNRDSKIATHNKINIAEAIDRAIIPGLQGGPHMNQIAAIAVALKEAEAPAFKKYAKQMVTNAKVLAKELKKYGWRLISGGTDTHLLLVDVAARGIGGKEASERLEKYGIIANKNMVPHDHRSPTDPSGIRLGTPVLTSRGMKEKEMKEIAKLIDTVLAKNKNVKREVAKLCRKYKNDR